MAARRTALVPGSRRRGIGGSRRRAAPPVAMAAAGCGAVAMGSSAPAVHAATSRWQARWRRLAARLQAPAARAPHASGLAGDGRRWWPQLRHHRAAALPCRPRRTPTSVSRLAPATLGGDPPRVPGSGEGGGFTAPLSAIGVARDGGSGGRRRGEGGGGLGGGGAAVAATVWVQVTAWAPTAVATVVAAVMVTVAALWWRRWWQRWRWCRGWWAGGRRRLVAGARRRRHLRRWASPPLRRRGSCGRPARHGC